MPSMRRDLAVDKFQDRLASLDLRRTGRLAFLVLSGSFNPVHVQHVRMMEAAKSALERLGWTVIVGYLAPSDDDYVAGKAGQDALSLGERVTLCELATFGSDWISVCSWGTFSSNRLRVCLLDRLKHDAAGFLMGRPLTGVEVMGSDTLVRILDKTIDDWHRIESGEPRAWYSGRIICCLRRPGAKGKADFEHIRLVTAPTAVKLGVNIMLVDTAQSQHRLEAVSSTRIRAFATKCDWVGLRAKGWLHPRVLERLEMWSEN